MSHGSLNFLRRVCSVFICIRQKNIWILLQVSDVCVWLDMCLLCQHVCCVSVCLESPYDMRESGHTLRWPCDGLTFYWNIVLLNQLLDKVTCWSVIVPYGTPPGALNLDSLPKCLRQSWGLIHCCTQTLSLSVADKRHRTRAQYLCDPIRGFLVENQCHLPTTALFNHLWQFKTLQTLCW